MASDYFTTESGETPLRDVRNSLLDGGDPFFVLADFEDYARAQRTVETAFKDKRGWARKAILNVSRSGKFSSDRAIRDYAERIWDLQPADVR
jgi:starch phosphorylase